MEEPEARESAIPPTRLIALGDGVFAIVMTLLVFELSVPALTGTERLGETLADMWPDFAVYVLSFLVLGVFWLIHHVLFDLIERYDTALVWLNIVYLMVAALVPFSTGLVAAHGATTATAIVYALNMLGVCCLGWAIFSYATHRHRLVSADLDPEVIRGGKRMGAAYVAYLTPAMAVSVIAPVVSFLLYGAFVAIFITLTVGRRGDIVMLWPPQRRSEAGSESAPSHPQATP